MKVIDVKKKKKKNPDYFNILDVICWFKTVYMILRNAFIFHRVRQNKYFGTR